VPKKGLPDEQQTPRTAQEVQTAITGVDASGKSGKASESQITVILYPAQLDYIDSLSLAIRKHTGAKVDRSKIIRGALSGLAEAYGYDLAEQLDFTGIDPPDYDKTIAAFIRNKLITG